MDLDEFSDDGLDDLPDNALQELENDALQATQAQRAQQSVYGAQGEQQHQAQQAQHVHHGRLPSQDARPLEYSDYGWDEDDDLDTTEVTNDVVGVPIGRPPLDETLQKQQQQHRQHQHQQQPLRPGPPPPNPRWNPAVDPADRPVAGPGPGLAGRQLHPGAGPPPSFAAFGSQRFQAPAQGPSRPGPSQFARPTLPQARFAPSQASQAQAPPGDIASALQQRVRALEAELNAARGEVSIIRSNSTRAQQQHDAEVARLKKLGAEQLSKQERVAQAAVAAEKTASTELQFLQRDMKEFSGRARRKDAGGPPVAMGTTTPRKAARDRDRARGFADGFDEMDMAPSPSKAQGRGKNAGPVAANVGERTPTKGKRKRPLVDSPVMALETHAGDPDVAMDDDRPSLPVPQPQHVLVAPAPPFEFLQLVLDHGCFYNQPPTFDVFSRFSFPSDPSTSFAAIIFQKLPLMGSPHRPMQLLVDFCELVVSIWARCFDEALWEPVKYLVALVAFTFQLHTTSVAPLVAANLAPTAQATICALAEGRHRLPDEDLSKDDSYGFLQLHIDTGDVLSLLHTAALACATQTIETDKGFELKAVDFWRLISLDFVLLLLTPKQKLGDIIGVLDLLATSSLPGSVGPITEEKEPAFVARVVIERVSAKLTEYPRSAKTVHEKRSVRVAALRTLVAFARYPFGLQQLALHGSALPRLVACLSTSIDDLYDQGIPPCVFPPANDDEPDANASLAPSTVLHRIISQSVLLIHALVTDPRTANVADIAQKLSASHGGSQRYLLALGRLTFAEEDLVLEAGIEADAVEAAHELLEMAVTPDEGEIVSEAFGA